ncbi:MAG: class I SAM-dependent methyltransferase family protein [Candidatus Aenigmarchaeota archaeon]|nr:class I SAM-dependent methyltransferase family protein [Candidatus Aenigmarchaeota archaeon]
MSALKKLLAHKLTKKQSALLRASFDIIGSIAIIEVPRELIKKQKIIAAAVLSLNPYIKTVAKKSGGHTGTYRRQKLVILAGEKTKVTEHKESGLRMKLNVETCYFSPRLVTERMRIASLVNPNEKILVMFSGVAPYPLILAKHSPAKNVIGIEMNPEAHKYAVENIALNKLQHKIMLYKGDVKKILPELSEKFDRIIMPLPKTGEEFLDAALAKIKKGGRIHLYQFAEETKFTEAEQKVLQKCKQFGKKCTILQTVKAGQHAPRVFRICLDVEVK